MQFVFNALRCGGAVLDPGVLPGYLLAVLLVTLPPGPDNAYIIAVAVARGPRAGVLSAVGMSLGMVVHVTAASLGLSLMLRSTPAVLAVVRLAGAAYLAWLAVTTLSSARQAGVAGPAAAPDHRILGRAVLTNLTNPKIILFFAAFLPQFARSGHGPSSVQFLTLGLIFLVIGLAWDSVVGLSAGRLSTMLRQGSNAAIALNVVAGLTFGTLAALLFTEALKSM
ncbi:LysE family translocator [Streptomyces tropicalis]|uniref:LysE family translocator n=1 Tax=Streptomyces tropicalis TaxID=3034234 RepID=A0ABT6A4Z7_9ACTN|nr:LysE family translocator [Streptomyces tropicalis]MDF3299436.1 LysE family translocator [Streptomyces tropicalis]